MEKLALMDNTFQIFGKRNNQSKQESSLDAKTIRLKLSRQMIFAWCPSIPPQMTGEMRVLDVTSLTDWSDSTSNGGVDFQSCLLMWCNNKYIAPSKENSCPSNPNAIKIFYLTSSLQEIQVIEEESPTISSPWGNRHPECGLLYKLTGLLSSSSQRHGENKVGWLTVPHHGEHKVEWLFRQKRE